VFDTILSSAAVLADPDSNKNDTLDPDEHPERIKVISWIRVRINLQMTSQNVWNLSLFKHFVKVLSLYFEARIRIRIRIRIKLTSRIQFRIKVMRIRNIVWLCYTL
jgi:hypothetical protein